MNENLNMLQIEMGTIKNQPEINILAEKHPLLKADLTMKHFYLNGLALLMSVDDEIDEKEKEYISNLIQAFDMGDDIINEMVEFAENPNPDVVKEMLGEINADPLMKKTFVVDCMMLAEKDGTLHENEKKFINTMYETFSFSEDEKSVLKKIAETVKNKDENKNLCVMIDILLL
ncbi:TerB family tellurite resistance protein [Chitinivibrio alkaliphilus]|uniref:Co-chaperone DjlA N-terminal domain-containing protein n=1 Tax=Chitinivibrio alkaliphilus ACht1 TaxID=1313304 RepID=U7D599_9BACT|nr:TerB family tellurite resistance protein [Chitinivibrio alkaliphilus]ERP30741.1 hypothetical protein CALK_2432 [Chitinivibrio alkaliphilus ACht1]